MRPETQQLRDFNGEGIELDFVETKGRLTKQKTCNPSDTNLSHVIAILLLAASFGLNRPSTD
jgi:hypothetical protein